MTTSRAALTSCLALGVVLGMSLALLAGRYPEWVAQHPGTILLGALAVAGIAALAVQRRMNRFERGHEARAEAFRIAMLAQFAPHLLEPGQREPVA